MIGLAILLSAVWAVYDVMAKKYYSLGGWWLAYLFGIPILAALFAGQWLIGALVFVAYFALNDPLRNYESGNPFFYSRKLKWTYIFDEEAGLYDIVNGRIVLMIEIFLLVVIISELIS